MKKNILLTGLPGCGKSTLINKLIIEHGRRVGMVTDEVRENDARTGFQVRTSNGIWSAIASVNFQTNFQVSKYFVNIRNLDIVLSAIEEFNRDDFLYLDEIGQMQLASEKFKQIATAYLDAPNICLATISQVFENDFTRSIKERKDVILVEITPENRSASEDYIRTLFSKIEKAKRYLMEAERFNINGEMTTIRTDHGLRHLQDIRVNPICECDYFGEHGICSHVIALEEYLSSH